MLTLFGIPNCDKCRAARHWFSERGVAHQFHDVRKDGLTEAVVRDWLSRLGSDNVINRRGKSWREVPSAVRDELTDDVACQLILDNPTLVKRPLIDTGSELLVGYDEDRWQQFVD